MYYPILRGRQNELLALKELLAKSVLSEKIIPVIEPVKLSPTLIGTLNAFVESNRDIIVIGNPQVGAFEVESRNTKNQQYKEKFINILKNKEVKNGIIVNKDTLNIVNKLHSYGINDSDIVTICSNPDAVKYYEEAILNKSEVRTIVPYAPAFRRIRNNRILLEDKFNKKNRNQDYINETDEFFSDDHLYYIDDGYCGFSDYSIIGEEYSESGFAPYAVAIHIVYRDDANILRIHHFVSETNDDISDPAGKFYQALTKLVEWNKVKKLDTIGIRMFEKIYEEQSYPGLGVVKKLSIMHHLETIGNLLNGESV